MDQAQIRQTAGRLIALRAELLSRYPFFGRLLLRLSFGFAECETAYTDMSRIVFDPAFASKLEDEQLSFVILHELMHCVLKHCTRGEGKLHLLYNIACDIVVNSILLEALDISGIKIAGESAMHLTPKGEEGRLYSAEEVYEMLIKEGGKDFPEIYGASSFDRHDIWVRIAADSIMEDVWDKYTKAAAGGTGAGSGIPESLRRVVAAAEHKPKISWRQVLHDYIRHNRGDYVFSPPDRRYSGEFILPSFQENVSGEEVDNIWYVIDTSGSVRPHEIAEAFEEIKDAIEQPGTVEGFVSFFDCEITEPIAFGKVEDIDKMIPVGGGGTSFHVIFEYLAAHMKEKLPRVIVIITDGCASFPDEAKALGVPVIWLIVNSGKKPPFGETVYIRTE
ncbi:MAG: VWA-like domain-containing protein [Clostridia bacterium]|nr:VWA-like domain-containing protein [Clostridia bacterium]